nr:hypothetical protein CFP56_79024 [Quercus suber]
MYATPVVLDIVPRGASCRGGAAVFGAEGSPAGAYRHPPPPPPPLWRAQALQHGGGHESATDPLHAANRPGRVRRVCIRRARKAWTNRFETSLSLPLSAAYWRRAPWLRPREPSPPTVLTDAGKGLLKWWEPLLGGWHGWDGRVGELAGADWAYLVRSSGSRARDRRGWCPAVSPTS